MEAYYEDDTVQLYLGDMREILPALGITADLIVADPPYAETSLARDRFRRVHETATHWYRGNWSGIHHDTPLIPAQFNAKGRTASHSAAVVPHTGEIGAHSYTDTGMRLARSVRRSPSVRRGIHPTQKPVEILRELIEYACPEGGLVVDPFAGSGSTLDAARQAGRRAIGIEAHEPYAEAAARRLDALVLPLDGGAA